MDILLPFFSLLVLCQQKFVAYDIMCHFKLYYIYIPIYDVESMIRVNIP